MTQDFSAAERALRQTEPYHFQRDRQLLNKQPRPPQPAYQPNQKPPTIGWGGDTIAFDFLKFKGKVLENEKGQILHDQWVPVSLGDTTIFSSDIKGNSSELRLIYSLMVSRDTKGGDYFTQISYSLVTK